MGEAHALGERIRRLVEGGQTSEGGTLSVGIATVLSEDAVRSEGHLLQGADQALYEAKQTGRNRVVSHRR
jgi:PleD family two-component response regulator